MHRTPWACAAALVVALGPTTAHAAGSDYLFPDGSRGFALATFGEIIPCVFIGFEALTETGFAGAPEMFLGDGFSPLVRVGESPVNRYRLQMAFADGSVHLFTPPAPVRGSTRLSFDLGTPGAPHVVDLALHVSGPGDVADWRGFDPQPEPPGAWFATQFGFAAAGDPDIRFEMFVNGVQQQFVSAGVPEPASWALFVVGFGLIGGAARRARRTDAIRFAPARV